ncbi:MAG: hypothetical protein JNL14_05485 [Devosia sp.]|uniref:DUF6968 family protein n=1 Tax=Devosia sp. TaxID=1871048 RepID=UPI001A3CD817|nr:hypothetical protein [Devosia sp.]MBL8597171.1 hypothetical protein [Devosia sp.]
MIIGMRELTAICKSGEHKTVALQLEAPVESEGAWRCWYEIRWPEDEWPAQLTRSFAYGVDSLSAIQMGLMKLGAELHFSSYHKEGKLYWTEGQIGCGVILPRDARDLLRGEDARYLG